MCVLATCLRTRRKDGEITLKLHGLGRLTERSSLVSILALQMAWPSRKTDGERREKQRQRSFRSHLADDCECCRQCRNGIFRPKRLNDRANTAAIESSEVAAIGMWQGRKSHFALAQDRGVVNLSSNVPELSRLRSIKRSYS